MFPIRNSLKNAILIRLLKNKTTFDYGKQKLKKCTAVGLVPAAAFLVYDVIGWQCAVVRFRALCNAFIGQIV